MAQRFVMKSRSKDSDGHKEMSHMIRDPRQRVASGQYDVKNKKTSNGKLVALNNSGAKSRTMRKSASSSISKRMAASPSKSKKMASSSKKVGSSSKKVGSASKKLSAHSKKMASLSNSSVKSQMMRKSLNSVKSKSNQ